MKKLSTIIFGLILAFGFVEPSFAQETEYDFRFSDTVFTEYDDVEEGNPYYVTWEKNTICNINGQNTATFAIKSATSSHYYFYGTPQQCEPTGVNGLWGGLALVNYLTISGVYSIQLMSSSTPGVIYYEDIEWDGIDIATSSNTATRFVLTDPGDQDTRATSTTFNINGYIYINEADLNGELLTENWYIRIKYFKNTDARNITAFSPLAETTLIIEDDFVATYNEFNTQTSITETGGYTITYELRRPSLLGTVSSFVLPWITPLYDPGLVARKTAYFVAGDESSLDKLLRELNEGITDSQASSTLATLVQRMNTCNPLGGNFGMLDCMVALFTLDRNSARHMLDNFQGNVFTHWPVGYVTRFIGILGTEATTTLPLLSFTFKEDAPFPGEFTVDIGDGLSRADTMLREDFTTDNSLLEAEEGRNVWDVVMRYFELVAWVGLLLYIIRDIMGIRHIGTTETHNYSGKPLEMSQRK